MSSSQALAWNRRTCRPDTDPAVHLGVFSPPAGEREDPERRKPRGAEYRRGAQGRATDDIVAHCDTEDQACKLRAAIADRLGPLGLELHPEKTKIVYCKDANRRGDAEHTSFDFLGYTFRGRLARGRRGFFVSFLPAMSIKAKKAKGQQIRAWHLNRRTGTDLSGLAGAINPQVRGWINYYGVCVPRTPKQEVTAEAMLSKRWRKEPSSLALRDQLNERAIPNHCKGRRLRAGVLSVAANGGGTSVRCAPRRRAKANLGEDDELAPFPEQVQERFTAWLLQQEGAGRVFTADQLDWLRLIRDHLAASLSIEPRELLDPPFSSRGGLGRARELFGQDLERLLAELTEIVAA